MSSALFCRFGATDAGSCGRAVKRGEGAGVREHREVCGLRRVVTHFEVEQTRKVDCQCDAHLPVTESPYATVPVGWTASGENKLRLVAG